MRLIAVSFGLAIAAAAFLLVWPIYSGFDGTRTTHATLLQVNGPRVVVPVVFPILILLFPLIFRRRAVRIIATILIGGFVLVSGFSIGVFYLPAAVTMLLATCLTPPADATNVSQ
jgi:hypothetical protein